VAGCRPGGGIARSEIVFFDVRHEPVVAAFDSTLEQNVRLAYARSIAFRAAAFNAFYHAGSKVPRRWTGRSKAAILVSSSVRQSLARCNSWANSTSSASAWLV
jgi:hypothetical protein